MRRKKIIKEIDKRSFQQKYKRDDQGRIIINMNVKDDTDFLSVFSESDTPVISSKVAEFIEDSTCPVLPEEQLTLRIHSSCIDTREREIYKEAIREHYLERFIAGRRELRRNTLIALLLTAAGVIILALAFFMEGLIGSTVWTQVVDIVAWVLLWEAVDIMVFKNRELRLKNLRCLSYISMNIEFYVI